MKKNNNKNPVLYRLILCVIMTAVSIILDGYLKIPIELFGAYALKLSFSMVPVIFLSIRFGPLYGGVCGAVTDTVQLFLFPMGAYNPLFTIGAFIMGFIPGLFFIKNKKIGKLRLLLSVFTGQMVGAALLNSLFLIISYSMSPEIIITRTLTQLILIPLFTLFLYLILISDNNSV